jgi:hypothetical protein
MDDFEFRPRGKAMLSYALIEWLIAILIGMTLAADNVQVGNSSKPITEIPFEVAFRGVPFVPVKVNSGSPMQFLLDTGGAGTQLDQGLAKKLGLEMGRGVATTSGNAELEVGVIRSATIQVGDARFEGRPIASPLAHLKPVFGRRLEGILGSGWMNA